MRRQRWSLLLLLLLLLLLGQLASTSSAADVVAPAAAARQQQRVLFCCAEDNALYQAAVVAAVQLHGTVRAAQLVQRTPAGNCTAAATGLPGRSGVLLLADAAPATAVGIPAGLLDLARLRGAGTMRLFLEYASPARASEAKDFFGATGRTPCPQFTRLVADPASGWC